MTRPGCNANVDDGAFAHPTTPQQPREETPLTTGSISVKPCSVEVRKNASESAVYS